jgi:hypothetical protein
MGVIESKCVRASVWFDNLDEYLRKIKEHNFVTTLVRSSLADMQNSAKGEALNENTDGKCKK